MALKIVAGIAVLVAVVLLYAATKPATFHIDRTIVITASPEKIFPLLNDLHNWPRWAPQDLEDPGIKRTFGGSASGVGATSDWSGAGSTGAGHMTIVQSNPLTSVVINVTWTRPFSTLNVNEFDLQPDAAGTRVTWRMSGPNLYIMKLMGVFTNMDRTMGKHFEQGLANLKAASER